MPKSFLKKRSVPITDFRHLRPRPGLHVDISLEITDACDVCGRNQYFAQPDGKRKCRSCGHVYEGSV